MRDGVDHRWIFVFASFPLRKVIASIRALKGATGSSRQAISKYIKSEFDADNATALKAALKKGVKDGLLVQVGQSFKVRGEEYEAPEDERVAIVDISEGTGRAVERGDEVVVSYAGQLTDSSGPTFDSANSFDFVLGAGDVIKGWDQGIVGMKKGGKRILVVPPKLGYGKKGSGADIPPDSTLFFSITLKDIRD